MPFQAKHFNIPQKSECYTETSLLFYSKVKAMPAVIVEISQSENGGPTGSTDLPPDYLELLFEHDTTVRELIRRTVEENAKVQLRESRRELQEKIAILLQGALTERQIHEQAAKGKVGMLSEIALRRKMRRSHIDIDAQVRRAWEAFEKKEFLLTVDGTMAEELDESVTLGIHTKVVFLRTGAFLWLPFRPRT